jgi:hypothetical protein
MRHVADGAFDGFQSRVKALGLEPTVNNEAIAIKHALVTGARCRRKHDGNDERRERRHDKLPSVLQQIVAKQIA